MSETPRYYDSFGKLLTDHDPRSIARFVGPRHPLPARRRIICPVVGLSIRRSLLCRRLGEYICAPQVATLA